MMGVCFVCFFSKQGVGSGLEEITVTVTTHERAKPLSSYVVAHLFISVHMVFAMLLPSIPWRTYDELQKKKK
jgi:hypothetical protein